MVRLFRKNGTERSEEEKEERKRREFGSKGRRVKRKKEHQKQQTRHVIFGEPQHRVAQPRLGLIKTECCTKVTL